MRQIPVRLEERSYTVTVSAGLLDRAGELLAPLTAGRAAVITDSHVGPLYAERLSNSLRRAGLEVSLLTLPAGEATKAFSTLPTVYEHLLSAGMTRRDLVVTLGGGVVGDLGGFAAATCLRGLPFVQVPTSLLAQVDASVGGKVAVDLPQGKNLVGAFYQPRAVLIDPALLATLPDRFFADGMAEVIKTAAIRDVALFEKLEQAAVAADPRRALAGSIDEIVARCCAVKAAVVEADEQDTGERMLLNFGHTVGHAIEGAEAYAGHSHGEAVAIGMTAVTRLAEQRGLSPLGTADRLAALAARWGLPTGWRGDAAALLPFLTRDKKQLGRRLTVVLLRAVGEGFLHVAEDGFFDPLGEVLA